MYRFPVMENLTQNDHFFQIFLCRNLGEWTLKLAMVDQGIVMYVPNICLQGGIYVVAK